MAIQCIEKPSGYRQRNGSISPAPYIRASLQFENASLDARFGLVAYNSKADFDAERPPIQLEGLPDSVLLPGEGPPIEARTNNIRDRMLRILTIGAIEALSNPQSPDFAPEFAGQMEIVGLDDLDL